MAVESAGRREIVEATLGATGMRNLFEEIVTVECEDRTPSASLGARDLQ